MFEQRDIILMPFPYSDLTGSKQRPALIISNNKLNKTQDRICCLITSNETKEGILLENNDFQEGDLPFESWIKPQRLFTVSEKIINKKLCKLTENSYRKILDEIEAYITL